VLPSDGHPQCPLKRQFTGISALAQALQAPGARVSHHHSARIYRSESMGEARGDDGAGARDGYGGWTPDTQVAKPQADRSTVYSLEEVSKHVTQRDAWIAVNGNVYDISPFIRTHWGHIGGGSGTCSARPRHPTSRFDIASGWGRRVQGSICGAM